MTNYLVSVETPAERKAFEAFVKAMELRMKKLKVEDAEDAGLLALMQPYRKDKKVSRSTVMKALKR